MRRVIAGAIIGMVVMGVAWAEQEIKPSAEVNSQYSEAGDVKIKAEISALTYANRLASEGFVERNPMKLGLAAMTYFALGAEVKEFRKSGMIYLEAATQMAKEQKDYRALNWLASLWADPVLGAGDGERASELRGLAQKYEKEGAGLGFGEAGGLKSLLPKEYLK